MLFVHNLRILNTRERSDIADAVKAQWGIPDVPSVLLLNNRNDVFTISPDIQSVTLQNLHINSLGLYIGEWREGNLRLSMEGSHLLGPLAKKNLIDLTKDQTESWLKGDPLLLERGSAEGFQLVAYPHPITGKRDFLGCGRYRESTLINFVPKARRAKEPIV